MLFIRKNLLGTTVLCNGASKTIKQKFKCSIYMPDALWPVSPPVQALDTEPYDIFSKSSCNDMQFK